MNRLRWENWKLRWKKGAYTLNQCGGSRYFELRSTASGAPRADSAGDADGLRAQEDRYGARAVKALAAALVEAQKKMPVVHKTATANTGVFSYSYVPLDQLIEKTKPVLSEHGLVISQFPSETSTGGPGLRTILMHGASGESVEATVPLLLNGKNDMQTLGGAISYARRYGWAAVLGIANDEDDDGAQVSSPGLTANRSGGDDAAGSGVVPTAPPAAPTSAPTEKQLSFLRKLMEQNNVAEADLGTPWADLSKQQVSGFIESLKAGTFNPASLAAQGAGFLDGADDDIPFDRTIDGLGN